MYSATADSGMRTRLPTRTKRILRSVTSRLGMCGEVPSNSAASSKVRSRSIALGTTITPFRQVGTDEPLELAFGRRERARVAAVAGGFGGAFGGPSFGDLRDAEPAE